MSIYANRWVVVTGVRDLDAEDAKTVTEVMRDTVVPGASGIIFGGARGVDTIALIAAWQYGNGQPRIVIVPGVLTQQPFGAADAIRRYATTLIELGLPLDQPKSFQIRNERMLTEGFLHDAAEQPIVAAFPNATALKGGTRNCMLAARRRGLHVEEYLLGTPP